jgi:PKD repeat protein
MPLFFFNFRSFIAVATLCNTLSLFAQVNYTANQTVLPYGGTFRLGYNPGFSYGWTEIQMADVAAGPNGAGAKTVRQGLFYELLTSYNYEIRLPQVQYYEALGMTDLTALILGGANGGTQYAPPEAVRDNTNYCPSQPAEKSELFKNMYLPIWDNGTNGTPYNDNNDFAAFLYKTVTTYKDYIKFWEIWNEPGFDDTGAKGYLKPGEAGNWWEQDPDPCDLKIKAPVEHYVRMLHIAWEIIKTIDPNAYVCMGAPGYPSFVDAVLRNTDNPAGGSVTSDYPLKGGAYFDCLAYHSYPHIDGSTVITQWPLELMRNSDRAAEGVVSLRDKFEAPMIARGYDGSTYPRKKFIITEMNVPRKPFTFQNSFGNDLIQRNFMIKSIVNLKKSDIPQSQVYGLSETKTEQTADFEFHLMGLYKNMDYLFPNQVEKTQEGVAAKTTSDLISNCAYDPTRSAALTPASGVRAEAFVRPDGKYIYVIWAKTQSDNVETAAANFTFPSGLNISNQLSKFEWDWSNTAQIANASNSNIALTGTPIFLLDNTIPANTTKFTANSNTGCVPMTVQFMNTSSNASTYLWSFSGGNPSTSTSANPNVTYSLSGTYDVSLTTNSGTSGANSTLIKANHIAVGRKPSVDFTYLVNGLSVTFYNGATLANNYLWEFGDGQTSTETNPIHTFTNGGNINVKLTATNACGSNQHIENLTLQTVPVADFNATVRHGCTPFIVQFSSTASNATSFNWSFPGGMPSVSSEINPIVTYNNVGSYNILMSVANAVGNDAETKVDYILVEDQPVASFTAETAGLLATFFNNSVGGTSFSWDFGDGQFSAYQTPTHTYTSDGVYTVKLTISNLCGSSSQTKIVTIVTTPMANFLADIQVGCIPFTVQYTNTSQASMANYEWSFPGGSPQTSSLKNPMITYQQPGIYSAILTVSNAAGSDFEKKDNYITVGFLPTAAFSKAINGQNVVFTNFCNNADTYFWNFGDGQTSTLATPTHFYASDGVFNAVLTATNECGSVSFSENVVIITPPTAAFSANVQSGCAPLVVQFQNNSIATAATYNWSFPDGNPSFSTAQNPVVTYDHDGIFNVVLNVANAAGNDSEVKNNYINIGGQPFVGFYSIGTNLSVQFTNASDNSTSFLWNFGDGTNSTEANPVHIYPNYGTFDVTLTAQSPCGVTVFTQTIIVSNAPQASFSVNNASGCAPFTVQFANESSANATSLFWSFPGGNPSVSTLQNPTVTYNVPGSYAVSLSVSNADGIDAELRSDYILVGQAPNAGFNQTVNAAQVLFQNTSLGATTFLWDFGDGQFSTSENPTHLYANDGIFQIKLTASNLCGSNSYTQSINIVTLPIANFSNSNSVGCLPLTVQFFNTSSSNANSLLWSFPGGIPNQSTDQNPLIFYTNAGTYPASLVVQNAAGQNTFSKQNLLEIKDFPTAEFSVQTNFGTAIFSNQSLLATSFIWDFGDGQSSTEQNPTHIYANSGDYVALLNASNECGNRITAHPVQITLVGIAETTHKKADFRLFPNPTNGLFTIKIESHKSESAQIIVMDLLGRILANHSVDLQYGTAEIKLDATDWADGFYRVGVMIEGVWQVKGLVR